MDGYALAARGKEGSSATQEIGSEEHFEYGSDAADVEDAERGIT